MAGLRVIELGRLHPHAKSCLIGIHALMMEIQTVLKMQAEQHAGILAHTSSLPHPTPLQSLAHMFCRPCKARASVSGSA